jgi:NAD+ synthase
MNNVEKINFISQWIKDYCKKSNINSLIIGISGGIDSAVTSTLSAKTGVKTFVVSMPILNHQVLNQRGINHIKWLKDKFSNIESLEVNLADVFSSFQLALNKNDSEHGYANSQARLRMATLYQIAASNNGIVVGTGNKVEDFGIGFYTKYGDGGVDISPIADCLKTEVWGMAKELGINQEIIDAPPTDGLWNDGRTDEDQVGLSYEEIEEAMQNENSSNRDRYLEIRSKSLHKMEPIPVCIIPKK